MTIIEEINESWNDQPRLISALRRLAQSRGRQPLEKAIQPTLSFSREEMESIEELAAVSGMTIDEAMEQIVARFGITGGYFL